MKRESEMIKKVLATTVALAVLPVAAHSQRCSIRVSISAPKAA
jgi:hypothetical protein